MISPMSSVLLLIHIAGPEKLLRHNRLCVLRARPAHWALHSGDTSHHRQDNDGQRDSGQPVTR